MPTNATQKFAFLLCGFIFTASFIFALDAAAEPVSNVKIIQLNNDTINPVTAQYIVHAIDSAHKNKAECLVIKLDTPGGLLDSTRSIVKKMLTAQIPVIVYISPDGSRAGSAGVFITYASHVAAMAPSTNIGAAHPVEFGGQKAPKSDDWGELKELLKDMKTGKDAKKDKKNETAPLEKSASDDPMDDKILNDTVAFIKAIAKTRNRNEAWAVESVTQSASITAQEALGKGVVDLIANNDRDLMEKLDGRVVNLNGENVTLRTKNAELDYKPMDFRENFFNVLANPNIVYILLILGFYALLFELTHPGAGLPGIAGATFLILAFYSMQTLPTNYAGLALLILGLGLLVAEAFVPGWGLFTIGGLICSILGSMLLFESADPSMQLSQSLIYSFTLITGIITFFILRLVIRSRGRRRVRGGAEGLIGEKGHAQTAFNANKEGKVFLHGEIWNAVSDDQIKKDDHVEVAEVNNMVLKVKKAV